MYILLVRHFKSLLWVMLVIVLAVLCTKLQLPVFGTLTYILHVNVCHSSSNYPCISHAAYCLQVILGWDVSVSLW